LYSEQEVERLELLHRATRAGHNISQVVKLPTEKLREVVSVSGAGPAGSTGAVVAKREDEEMLEECLEQVRRLDSGLLYRVLHRGLIRLGHMGFLNRVAAPLSWRVGELWRGGEFTAAHEHFLSAALRTFLGETMRQYPQPESAPVIVVGTPAGQVHELGALMAAAAAANLGWRVTYLGTSLPATEIAGIAIQRQARVVALSLVYPEDDAGLAEELANLRAALPADVRIVVGGRAAESYRDALEKIGAFRVADLDGLMVTLDQFRKQNGGP